MSITYTHDIFKMLDDDSVMSRFYCITFKKFILAGKTLDCTNSFSPNDFKNDNAGFEFRLKKKKIPKQNFFQKKQNNGLINKKHKKICKTYMNT